MTVRPSPAWHDKQYNNRARVPDALDILRSWDTRSAATRAQLRCLLDVPYGMHAAERLDIFPARPVSKATATAKAPVLIHIHGGYWRALSKSAQSFIAEPFVSAGAMVVVPGYALCPAVRIDDITLQIVRAVAWVWRHAVEHGGDANRIVVAGHSAGGHLAAMMLNCDWPRVSPDLPTHVVKSALAVSGVFDLEPLRHAPFLAPDLGLTPASARKLSPACMPAPGVPLVAMVGGDESDAFLQQNLLIQKRWGHRAVPVCEAVPGFNHMSVLAELANPKARMHTLALGLLGLAPSAF
jgi:arylformamidase